MSDDSLGIGWIIYNVYQRKDAKDEIVNEISICVHSRMFVYSTGIPMSKTVISFINCVPFLFRLSAKYSGRQDLNMFTRH